MEILYFGVWCRPFHNYWALPTPNRQCDAATNHLITNAVLNISSDIMMLAIAFSLFSRSRLPWNRKAILCGIFGLGIFVILAAILNKYYSFTHPFGTQWTYWYVRESSTAILVANLPFIWTLLRRIFKLKSFDHAVPGSEIPWHSSRSAMGRNPSAHPGRSGALTTKTHASATHTATLAMREKGPAAATARKHDSQSSKGSSDGEWAERAAAAGAAAGATAGAVPPPARWRNHSVYGRADLEDRNINLWDYGADVERGDSVIERPAPAAVAAAVAGAAAAGRPVSPPSPIDHRRRIKSHEEMLRLQEGMMYKYNGMDDAI